VSRQRLLAPTGVTHYGALDWQGHRWCGLMDAERLLAFWPLDPSGATEDSRCGLPEVAADIRRDDAALAVHVQAWPVQAHRAVALLPGTAWQRQVWAALLDIPSGSTQSYSELAARLGRPESVRAAAGAVAANPLALLIPCHRVCRADGGLGGYRWGLELKRQLLREEGGGRVSAGCGAVAWAVAGAGLDRDRNRHSRHLGPGRCAGMPVRKT